MVNRFPGKYKCISVKKGRLFSNWIIISPALSPHSMSFDAYLALYTKIRSKWIIDQL